jgi:RNA polymerase sigma-70 factor (ECF subfamily)
MNSPSDEAILSLMRNRETREQGFTLLMETYKEKIYWHIRRLVVSHDDAEDILQETFMNAFRHQPSFRGECRIYTWLYRIATNECIRFFRRGKKRNGKADLSAKACFDMPYNDPGTESHIIARFQEAILRLPERQRIVFTLRYYEELSYEEMAQVLDSSVNALKTNYHYACEKVKDYLLNYG